jgi:dTDP-4-amino-4,6-dideoxygalactose transaminase
MSQQPFIPFHRPQIDDAEIDEVVSTLRSGWLTTGGRTARFEKEFKEYVGARFALAVNSGTAAMHLALAALGIGAGDEVITTPLTFCATVTVILHAGATPVLADIGPDGNINPASIEKRITPRTKAILPVHFGGAPCDMDSIWRIARKHNLFVIEDAAHAAGTLYKGRHVGAQGFPSHAVAFSFYATKNLTTGEGGMVTTDDESLVERMRMLALHGINRDAWGRYRENGNWYYEVHEAGFKYNLSDIQSAVGIHQLRKLEASIEQRTRYAQLYTDRLADLEQLELPAGSPIGRHCWHLYALRLNLDRLTIDRASFISELRARNIGASVHFIPIPLHPFFQAIAPTMGNDCPECLKLYPRLVSLPLYPAMSEADVEYVAEAVREIVAKFRRPGIELPTYAQAGTAVRTAEGSAA